MGKSFILFIVMCSFLASCTTSTTRFVKLLDEKTSHIKEEPQDWLVVNCDIDQPTQHECQELKRSFIPAIVFWGWHTKFSCQMDVDVRLDCLKKGIHAAADDLELFSYLDGRKLELDIKYLPGQFEYTDRGHFVYLLIFWSSYSDEYIDPFIIDLEYDYFVKQDENIEAKGQGIVYNTEPLAKQKFTLKKTIRKYFEAFEFETERMGYLLVENLIKDLRSDSRPK